jgi:hypothetical protein
LIPASVADADVQFDVSSTVACIASTTPEFRSAHPHEKIVTARFVVSMFIADADATTIKTALYHIVVPEGPAAVIDYAPRTTSSSGIVGNIDVSNNSENSNHAQIGGNAHWDGIVSANASTGRNRSEGATLRYKLRPPLTTVFAAGTSNRGRGVYFKLRRTPYDTLEGDQQLTVQLRVAENWRGGYARVFAQARGDGKIYPASSFLVPLYLLGDAEARRMANQLLTFEHRLLETAAQHRGEIKRASRRTVVQELSWAAPAIPSDWQQQVLWQSSLQSPLPFISDLPRPVQLAVSNYLTAKRVVMALGRQTHEPVSAARSEENLEPIVDECPTEQIHAIQTLEDSIQPTDTETVATWKARSGKPPAPQPHNLGADPSTNP